MYARGLPPDSGAFKVWPGSHRQFYPLFPMQYDQARIPFYEHLPSHKGIIHPEAYLDAVKAVESSIQPVIAGDRGRRRALASPARSYGGPPPRHRGLNSTSLLFDYNHVDLDKQSSTHPRRICGGIGAMRLTPPTLAYPQNFWRAKGFIRRAQGSHAFIIH